MTNKQNAIIQDTMLGEEDHGIFTCMLYLKLEIGQQGFGGYGLDEYDKIAQRRIDRNGMGLEYIKRILDTVGVQKWEDLKGQHIRILKEDGWNSPILGIGHIMEDRWFEPKKWFEQYIGHSQD